MNQGPPDRLLRSLERYLRDATRADLEDFLADRLARRSAATAATRYKVLRVLYRWLEEEEDVLNPMEKMRRRSSPSSP
jgi:site-specific recombinase XerD